MQIQDKNELPVKGAYAAPEPIAMSGHAFFFDMDGTLVPIASTPDDVRVPASILTILQRLVKACDGAVAVVSGRPLAEIDHLLHPLVLPVAGLHGAQWRDPDGTHGSLEVDTDRVARMAIELQPLLDSHSGLLLEFKGKALAVHYRHAPEFADDVRRAMEALMQEQGDGFVLQPGKMVVEIKPALASKSGAIERFMNMPPFAGRIPLFAGDDLTDEAGFVAVQKYNGLTIKIGEGDTVAHSRLAGPEALAQWLAKLT